VIENPWSMSAREFYVDYQPWITLIYAAIFASPEQERLPHRTARIGGPTEVEPGERREHQTSARGRRPSIAVAPPSSWPTPKASARSGCPGWPGGSG
jgi:hypothetical protein